jgi:hypothetical protein
MLVLACGDGGAGTASASGTTSTTTQTTPSTLDPTSGTAPTTSNGSADATNTEPTVGSVSDSEGQTTTPDPTTVTTVVTTDQTSVGPDPQTDTTNTTTTSTSTTTGDSTSTGNDESTGPVVCNPGDTMGMGMVDKSYIWIPSQDLTDVAKVNTQTLIEVARYKTGAGGDSPSRTAVSADGRYVVVNGRQSGRSTMFAANLEDCIDSNGNGMIDTSQNKDDVRPWMTDECMRWTIVWPFAGSFADGPRGVTWTPGTFDENLCQYVDPKVWLGYQAPGGVAHFVRVDGQTGTVEETLVLPGWNGQGYSPYGAALDPEFRPWFGGLRGEFVRINSDLNPITITEFQPGGEVQTYGFTVDRDGDPWHAGCVGAITHFNPDTNTYTPVPGTSQGCLRGIAADENYVWAASNGPCGIYQVDRLTKTLVKFHVPQPCSTAIGVSIDLEKFVWLVDQEGWAWKIDPENVPAMQQVMVTGSHYVYSDMTGGQVLSVLPQ